MIFIKKEYALKIYKTVLTELRKRGLTMEEIVLWHLIFDSYRLHDSCQYTNRELMEYLGVCKRSVQNYIARLKQMQLLKTTENPRNLMPCDPKTDNKDYKSFILIKKSKLKEYIKILSMTSIMIYQEINSVGRKTDICYAGNKYFCDLFVLDKKTLNKSLKELKKKRFIYIQNHRYTKKGQISTQRIIITMK